MKVSHPSEEADSWCFCMKKTAPQRRKRKNMKNDRIVKLVTAAVCIALCVILPLAFHLFPDGGTLFSPMHLPVLVCGIVCGWQYGLACGIIGPLLSFLITGRPGPAYLPSMMVELALYGLITGLMMKLIHTGKLASDLYISLLTAMLAGRIVTGILRALVFAPGAFTVKMWATGYFVSSFPGIVLQLILVPAIYLALQRARLIPSRYSK